MNYKIINSTIRLVVIAICLTANMQGCGDTAIPGNNSQNLNRRMRITQITPSSISGEYHQTFDVTCKLWDVQNESYHLNLVVSPYPSNNCVGWEKQTTIDRSVGYTRTITVNVDSLVDTCISPNSLLRISVWATDGIENVGEDACWY